MSNPFEHERKTIYGHLQKTSRSFVLPISMLDERAGEEVATAYLLLRIADSFEDATCWDVERRRVMLHRLAESLEEENEEQVRSIVLFCRDSPPLRHEAYLNLIEDFPVIMRFLGSFPLSIKQSILYHVNRAIQGMIYFVGIIAKVGCAQGLQKLSLLRSYCYSVAGIVGELYTDLAIKRFPDLTRHISDLQALAPNIGEALQLTNILKDELVDREEGRAYIPEGTRFVELAARIRQGYESARKYIDLFLEVRAPRGYMAFVAVPILMSMEMLRSIVQGMSKDGNRDRMYVHEIVKEVASSLERNCNPLHFVKVELDL